MRHLAQTSVNVPWVIIPIIIKESGKDIPQEELEVGQQQRTSLPVISTE
jgi:hypothetical protein